MTEGERLLIGDLNDFVRYTSQLTSEIPQSTGIRPHPVIESSETSLETTRIGLSIQDTPEEVNPGSDA